MLLLVQKEAQAMRRFRRRKKRVSWSYSDEVTLLVEGAAGSTLFSYVWLLPPARAQFMMDTASRDSIVFAGCHLWLDFYWRNVGAQTTLPDVDFGIFKTVQQGGGNSPDLNPMLGQWKQPATPAALTSWLELDDDGTEGFLWSHHIKGMTPPNAVVNTNGANTVGGNSQNTTNQAIGIGVGTADAPSFVCRKFAVTQEWQPDVVVRSKRRLQKDEGIILAMAATPSQANTQACVLETHFRTLTSF